MKNLTDEEKAYIEQKADFIADGLLRLVEMRRRIREIDEQLYRLTPERGYPL